MNGAGAGGSGTNTPCLLLRPGTNCDNAAVTFAACGMPMIGAAARNQFSGNVWSRKNEVKIFVVARLVVPTSVHSREIEGLHSY